MSQGIIFGIKFAMQSPGVLIALRAIKILE